MGTGHEGQGVDGYAPCESAHRVQEAAVIESILLRDGIILSPRQLLSSISLQNNTSPFSVHIHSNFLCSS